MRGSPWLPSHKAELQAALAECRRTVGSVLPCHEPAYLEARRVYHKLLVRHGLLDRRLADV